MQRAAAGDERTMMMCAGPTSTAYQKGVLDPADLNGVGYRWLHSHRGTPSQ